MSHATAPARATSRAPRRRPAVALVASLVGAALIALAVVTVRDLAVAQGWATGSSWTTGALEALDGLTASTAVLTAGIACGVVGLLLLLLVLRPASRTHEASDVDGADVWVSTGAVAALAREAADRATGVLRADARATRRRVKVTVTTARGAGDVQEPVRRAVEEALQGLARHRVSVRTTTSEEDA